ncbi:MAG: site-2 protease family protein [archaeon]
MGSSIYFYDIAFLILFAIFTSSFLYLRRKNLRREGLLFIYRTSWGIKLINSVGKKSPGFFKFLSYVSITTGYLLMAGMFYLLGRIVYLYIAFPSLVREIKVPPITPLIPYLPEIFKIDFLPPFYFTYWIIIIAIVAISHEFFHGIFAAHDKLKIKSTGFGFFPFFFPIFPAAFVELDEKKMATKSKFSQLAVLSAGTFANVITAILFFALLIIFFQFAFSPSGVVFDSYSYNAVAVSAISSVNGINIENPNYGNILNLVNESGLNRINAGGESYVITKEALEKQSDNNKNLVLYYDAPAINAQLENVLLGINEEKLESIEDIERELSKYSPGESVTLNVLGKDGENYDRDITLGENPGKNNLAWLGIVFIKQSGIGAMGKISSLIQSFKNKHVYYKSNLGEFGTFIYDLIQWLAIISISVALINMLPVGIFDGGRFFYLTILAITGSEMKARKAFAFSTYFILFLILILMVFWFRSFI